MAINWFPGHMHKARKEIKESMSQIDLIIEVLDALQIAQTAAGLPTTPCQ